MIHQIIARITVVKPDGSRQVVAKSFPFDADLDTSLYDFRWMIRAKFEEALIYALGEIQK